MRTSFFPSWTSPVRVRSPALNYSYLLTATCCLITEKQNKKTAGIMSAVFCIPQSRSGPGSISPPPLVDEPNFGVVSQPLVVVRGGFSF